MRLNMTIFKISNSHKRKVSKIDSQIPIHDWIQSTNRLECKKTIYHPGLSHFMILHYLLSSLFSRVVLPTQAENFLSVLGEPPVKRERTTNNIKSWNGTALAAAAVVGCYCFLISNIVASILDFFLMGSNGRIVLVLCSEMPCQEMKDYAGIVHAPFHYDQNVKVTDFWCFKLDISIYPIFF